MVKILRYVVQIFAYMGLALAVGYFSSMPQYDYASAERAAIKVSLSHATDRVKPCVLLTPEEVAALAPNMRRPERCERQRLPLTLELDVDGEAVLSLRALPSGVWSDGPASVYQRFELPPGPHMIAVRLRDSARAEGWDYTHSEDVDLQAGRYLAVTFRPETGGFKFR